MKKTIATILMLSFVLTGCTTLKKWFGLNKSAPDETKIETRAPLVLPPDFDDLP
jgi:hypothetical protein